MEDLSEDEIIELGNFCEALSISPKWNSVVKQFELQIVDQMMNTKPHEQKMREGLYAQCQGFRDFQTHMSAFVSAKDKLVNPEPPAASEYDPQAVEDI